jgi:acyl-CoA synthetase (AMP-forming)/AMP-acid ligase II
VSAGWNFAEVWEAVAERLPDAPAQRHADAVWSWRQFDQRADAIAAHLLAAGVSEQDKVAQYLYNGPEYLESVFAALKAGLAVVNTNYRYRPDELAYLWDNADVVALVFHGAFVEQCAAVRQHLTRIHAWLWVDDGTAPCPSWATPYEEVTSPWPGRTVGPWGRSGAHLLLLYTGGTTGMPKGVMWRQDDLFRALDQASRTRLPPPANTAELAARLDRPGPSSLPAAPLMHGTGLFNAMTTLSAGGSIVTLTARRFDVVELLDTVERERVKSMTIVGDAFGRPILRALDAEPDRWDISSLRVIISSGVMWSSETKDGLLRHNERLILVDTLGSSEAIGMATSATTADTAASPASFQLAANTRVITESGADVVPGSGELGLVAMSGPMPLGYYKDPDKSAATFRVVDGVRYTIPGDWASIDADGTVRLLGRGSQCINTGGEKVYPEEVEEVLKQHPAVADAAVVGIPDERFGEAVHALVELAPGAEVDDAGLIDHVKRRLAAYKAPKRVITVDSLHRAPNGKLDYAALKQTALRSPGPGRCPADPGSGRCPEDNLPAIP